MKLRIFGDSLRLRLSKGEVEQMGAQGRVQDAIHFGPGGPQLVYVLVADTAVQAVHASFAGGEVTVRVPAEAVRAWVDSDQVGMSATQGELSILVEKDFKCVVPREGEESYDGFDNPGTSC
jgi:hypothetical protein